MIETCSSSNKTDLTVQCLSAGILGFFTQDILTLSSRINKMNHSWIPLSFFGFKEWCCPWWLTVTLPWFTGTLEEQIVNVINNTCAFPTATYSKARLCPHSGYWQLFWILMCFSITVFCRFYLPVMFQCQCPIFNSDLVFNAKIYETHCHLVGSCGRQLHIWKSSVTPMFTLL